MLYIWRAALDHERLGREQGVLVRPALEAGVGLLEVVVGDAQHQAM